MTAEPTVTMASMGQNRAVESGEMVKIEVFDLTGDYIYTAVRSIGKFAEYLKASWEIDLYKRVGHNAGQRRYYRCTCGERQFDVSTPKVEGRVQP